VVEDGVSGVFGAQKAGMNVIGFGTAVRGLADYTSDSVEEVRTLLFNLLKSHNL